MVEHCPWSLDDVVEVEREFHIRDLSALGLYTDANVQISGKIDVVARHTDGSLFPSDYKTRRSIAYADSMKNEASLEVDLQSSLYSLVFPTLYECEPKGFRFQLVKRPEIRQRKRSNENHEDYCRRIVKEYENTKKYYNEAWVRKDDILGYFIDGLDAMIENIERCRRTGIYQKAFTQCANAISMCDYYHMCYRKPGWEDMYEKVGRDHHPELKGV
jgi:hypothetical protein